MANLRQRTINSVRKIYPTAKQMQYAVHVLFCPFFEKLAVEENSFGAPSSQFATCYALVLSWLVAFGSLGDANGSLRNEWIASMMAPVTSTLSAMLKFGQT